MLDYLDALCAALLARNSNEIRRLLRHPLARALPRRVREEGYAIAKASPDTLSAPVQTLHFYHQTLTLLGNRVTEPQAREAVESVMALRAKAGSRKKGTRRGVPPATVELYLGHFGVGTSRTPSKKGDAGSGGPKKAAGTKTARRAS